MFSGLTTLIFGNTKKENNSEKNLNVTKSCNISFKTTEDDGWVVVSGKKKRRKGSSESSDFTNVTEEDVEPSLNLDISCDFEMDCEFSTSFCPLAPIPSSSPPQTTTPPSPASPASLTHLEPDGSWYLTPPPCFTAGSNTSANPVLSPMENLLIEHPSMSVYQRTSVNDDHSNNNKVKVAVAIRKLQERALSPTVARSSPENVEEVGSDENKKVQVQVARGPRRESSSIPTTTGYVPLLAELFKREISENVRLKTERRKTKNLCRNQLDRNNKSREFSSSSKNNRRKDRMRNASGMSNNRKC